MKALATYRIRLVFAAHSSVREVLATSPADALRKAHANYPGALCRTLVQS